MAAKSSETITWLHISDLHLRNSRAYDANVVLKALLRDIGERIAQDGLHPDLFDVVVNIHFIFKIFYRRYYYSKISLPNKNFIKYVYFRIEQKVF